MSVTDDPLFAYLKLPKMRFYHKLYRVQDKSHYLLNQIPKPTNDRSKTGKIEEIAAKSQANSWRIRYFLLGCPILLTLVTSTSQELWSSAAILKV